jgi:membrane protease YdiL (CAAX protease family)
VFEQLSDRAAAVVFVVLVLGTSLGTATVATTAGVSAVATAGVVALGFARFSAPPDDWARNVLLLCVTGPILAFAEEIGWRGYLQPRLAFLGERTAVLVIGLVWICWHLPYVLLTPDYHSDGNRVVVLAHFAHNATFAALTTYAISTERPVVVNEYLAGDTGLFVLIGTVVCAIWLSRSVRPARG